MIISHHYRFCFFAIPRTGSQALSNHLINNYAGVKMGAMHCSYDEFHAETDRAYSDYFSFTIIRNPLDSLVSSYFKKKTDHNQRFSRGTFRNGKKIGPRSMEEFNFIKKNGATFSEYFLHFFTDPPTWPRHTKTKNAVNKVMHFESLESDFQDICGLLHMPYQPVPHVNKTNSRASNWQNYYTEEARQLARKSLQTLMDDWGYSFPEEW